MNIIRYQPTRMGLWRPFSTLVERSPLADIERELDRLMGFATRNFLGEETHRRPTQPRIDFYEDKDNFYLRAEVPGMRKEDIHVELGDGALSISGERKVYDSEGKESQSFRFSRSVSTPAQVTAEGIRAAYENGILTVTLPKKEEAKPRKISIAIE